MPPPWAEYLWGWFFDLSSGRGNSGWGPLPLSWSDIRAWSELRGLEPSQFELEVLRVLDTAWLAAMLRR